MKKLLLIFLTAMWFSSGPVWAQGTCIDTTISATGRTLLAIPLGGARYPAISFTYRTTGSPSGVSIAIEASNVLAATETPITMIPAVTTTSGNVDLGSAARPFRFWYANVATLSGGTSPTIVLTACPNAAAFAIAEFTTAPTFSSMTENSIPYFGAGGLLSENNANFSWTNGTTTFNAATITEGGNTVPNSTNDLGFFAATTSALLAGVLSNETGSGLAVFGTSATFAAAPTFSDMTAGSLFFAGTGGLP